MRLAHEGREVVIEETGVRKAVFEPAEGLHMAEREGGPLDVSAEARSGFGEPVNLPGELGALLTGRLIIIVKAPDGSEVQKTFAVLNDRLLRDEAATDNYYRASQQLIAAMQGKAS